MVVKPKVNFIHQPNIYSQDYKMVRFSWPEPLTDIDLSSGIEFFLKSGLTGSIKVDDQEYQLSSGNEDFRIEWIILITLVLKKLQIEISQSYLSEDGFVMALPYPRFLPKTFIQIVELAEKALAGQVVKKDLQQVSRVFSEEKDLIGIVEFYQRLEKQRIPFYHISNRPLIGKNNYQIGQGMKAKRMVGAGLPSSKRTLELSRDKNKFKKFAIKYGFPVAKGGLINKTADFDTIIKDIGFPMIVKPISGSLGRGISPRIDKPSELDQALKKNNHNMLVEQFVQGKDYRILCLAGKVRAVAEREPASVTGDGKQTVEQLLKTENEKRINYQIKPYYGSDKLLQDQELDWQAVPIKDQQVFLRYNANLSTGGRAIDRTDAIHPQVQAKVEELVKEVNCQVAGVDLITEDISKPLTESSAFIEINSSPGLSMHYGPDEGKARDLTKDILKIVDPKEDFNIKNILIYNQPDLVKELKGKLPENVSLGSNQKELITDLRTKSAIYDLDEEKIQSQGLYASQYDLLFIGKSDLESKTELIELLKLVSKEQITDLGINKVLSEIANVLDN